MGAASLTSCKKEGCTDEAATNYDANAKTDDGSCEYPPKEGCTDPTATNYDAEAEVDDGTCEYPSLPCDEGVEFCMDYGGTNKSGDAEVFEYTSSHYRVYWTAGAGNDYEQVELDIYGSTDGSYDIDTTGAAGTASFQYFSTANGVQNGVSGTLEISEFDFGGNGLTGTFEATTEDGTEVTAGGFVEAL